MRECLSSREGVFCMSSTLPVLGGEYSDKLLEGISA